MVSLDQLAERIKMAGIDLENSPRDCVEEVGCGDRQIFCSGRIVRENGPRQIKRAWCQLEWVHRFRAPRRLPELHKRSARPENCQRPTERVRPDRVENSCHAIAAVNASASATKSSEE